MQNLSKHGRNGSNGGQSSATQQMAGHNQFVRIGDLQRLFGITRPTAYVLAKHGKIQTISLCRPDRKRGARLVNVPSVRAYLRELLEAQGGEGGTKRNKR